MSTAIPRNASAILLAGGSSRRMGFQKALLEVDGEPLLARLVRSLEPEFQEVLVVAAQGVSFPFLACPVAHDRRPGEGPLMGIASGLRAMKRETAFVLACDQPEVPLGLVDHMLSLAEDADAVIPVLPSGFSEPLFAVYQRSILPLLEAALDRGVRRVVDAFEGARIRACPLPDDEAIWNLNTPQDLERWLRWRRGAPP